MKRRVDWEARLAAYLEKNAAARFEFGRKDCALFAAGAVRAVTGHDPAKPFRGKYRSHAGSVREIKAAGYGSLVELVNSLFPSVPPAFARRGDLVADRDGSLGVCIGGDALFVGEENGRAGLVRIAMTEWATAWRVGE